VLTERQLILAFLIVFQPQLVVGASGYVILVDVETGKQLWEVNLKGTGYGTVSLCCFNGQIFAGSNGTAWGITADTGSVLWSNNLSVRASVMALFDKL
jgi:outer membrane protein assembly factor BamB